MTEPTTLPISRRSLGRSGLSVSPLGYGAFKIGRNQKIKYPQPFDLPDDATTQRLLNTIVDAGINLIDTAPAYGISEQRIGRFLSHRRDEIVLSTKVGETFEDGKSTYDFSGPAIRASIKRSLKRLRTDRLDLVLIHSNGEDDWILDETDAVATLQAVREQGDVRAIGFSGKLPTAARRAMEWADVLMVEYHVNDTSHAEVIAEAYAQDIGVLVKKGLAAGHLPPETAIPFVLGNRGVSSLVVGGLNVDHLAANLKIAAKTVHD